MALSDYINTQTGADGKLYIITGNVDSEDRAKLQQLQYNVLNYTTYEYTINTKDKTKGEINIVDNIPSTIIAWNKPSADYKDWQMRG